MCPHQEESDVSTAMIRHRMPHPGTSANRKHAIPLMNHIFAHVMIDAASNE
jgi:hypothetical protein